MNPSKPVLLSSTLSFRPMNQAWAVMLLLFAGAFLAPNVQARGEAILNISSSPIPAGLDATRIEKGIQLGGVQRGWVIKPLGDGHMEATITLRKHVATVDIRWSSSGYSITYRDSVNLDHDPARGTIHRNYNKWIRNLDADIRKSLTMIALQ